MYLHIFYSLRAKMLLDPFGNLCYHYHLSLNIFAFVNSSEILLPFRSLFPMEPSSISVAGLASRLPHQR
ncbi:hypothetical protein RIF29_09814 [Crotalaria pallida]|uniref:Uncharacterized protein n=1 Tax=Crotalaria pallida TaxID=3830 RepID=A0AAN9FV37_CROPI